MKKILVLGTLAIFSASAFAADLETRVAQSRLASKEFMQSLKGELQAAMKAGGPINAIQVCRIRAPQIASDISGKKGWKVARTSLKVRNSSNAPDAWERTVLQRFEAEKLAGKDPAKMEFYEVVKTGNGDVFRYMKAIPAGKLCMTCHGSNIAPELVKKIDELYPNDQARGYSPGDIRGAFTIQQGM
jgi:hypothetical protein